MEKLSIVVPVYNIVNYLEECVDSLIGQKYRNCEIILVDDGSTDGSSVLCDNLCAKDDRIKVIHQKNQGLSGARNSGLMAANGAYISFIDSDDYVSPEMFAILILRLEETGASVAICNFEVFNKGGRYPSHRYGNRVIDFAPDTQTAYYSAALDSSCNRVFRAEPIRENTIIFEHKNIVAQEDYWFQVRLFSHINRIVTIEDCLYHYRERGSSITKSHFDGDITARNIYFYIRSEEYIKKETNRSIEWFMEYMLVNLFTASINNASEPKAKVLLEILSHYKNLTRFKTAISLDSIKRIFPGSGLRNNYTRMTFVLLRNGFESIYACLEAIRLRRLRSNDRTNLYFE